MPIVLRKGVKKWEKAVKLTTSIYEKFPHFVLLFMNIVTPKDGLYRVFLLTGTPLKITSMEKS